MNCLIGNFKQKSLQPHSIYLKSFFNFANRKLTNWRISCLPNQKYYISFYYNNTASSKRGITAMSHFVFNTNWKLLASNTFKLNYYEWTGLAINNEYIIIHYIVSDRDVVSIFSHNLDLVLKKRLEFDREHEIYLIGASEKQAYFNDIYTCITLIFDLETLNFVSKIGQNTSPFEKFFFNPDHHDRIYKLLYADNKYYLLTDKRIKIYTNDGDLREQIVLTDPFDFKIINNEITVMSFDEKKSCLSVDVLSLNLEHLKSFIYTIDKYDFIKEKNLEFWHNYAFQDDILYIIHSDEPKISCFK